MGFTSFATRPMTRPLAELRRRKQRDEKPFAVMVPDIETAERFCEIDAEERALLLSARRPIVLLRKRQIPAEASRRDNSSGRIEIADGVAPGNPYSGRHAALHAFASSSHAGRGWHAAGDDQRQSLG